MTAQAQAGEQAVVLQAASVYLQYPDDRMRELMPLVRSAVDDLHPGAARDRLTAFADHAAATPPGRLAEHYV